MSRDDLKPRVGKLIELIEEQWGDDVSAIQYRIADTTRANIFTLKVKIFEQFDVKMDYENSMLGVSVKQGDSFIALSKLTNEKIYKGFESYEPSKLRHNLGVLDRTLRKIAGFPDK